MQSVLIAMLLILVVTLSVTPVTDFDIWTHLGAGRYITEHRTVPSTDPFSWTRGGQPWTDHEWLFQVLAWQVFRASDVTGLILAKTALVGAAFLGLLVLAYRPQAAGLTTGLVALAALASYPRFLPRPEVASLVMTVAFLLVLERVRHGGRPALLWILVGLEWLWANLHGYFVLGNVVLTIYLVGESLAHVNLLGRRVQEERFPGGALLTLGWVWATAWTVTVATPNLFEGALYPYRMLVQTLWGQPAAIAELQSPLYYGFTTATWCWMMLVAITVVGLFVRGRKALPTDFLLVAAGAAASLAAQRNVPYFAAVAVVVSARQWGGLWSDLQQRRGLSERRWGGWAVKPALVLPVVALVGWQTWRVATDRLYLDDVSPQRTGIGVDPGKFSQASLEFLTAHRLDGRLFNDFAEGGFLIFGRFPHNTVAIDGRMELYGLPGLLDYSLMARGSKPLVDPATGELLRVAYLGLESATTHGLIRRLCKDSAWKLVFADGACVIFVPAKGNDELPSVDLTALARRTLQDPPPEPRLPGLAGRNFDWSVSNVASLLEIAGRPQLSEEVLRGVMARYPQAAPPRRHLARYLLTWNRPKEAIEVLLEAHRLDPDLPELPRLLGQAYAATGNVSEARTWLERGRRASFFRPADMEATGDVYVSIKMWREAADCYASAGGRRPTLAVGIKQVKALAQAGEIERAVALAEDLHRRYPSATELTQVLSIVHRLRNR